MKSKKIRIYETWGKKAFYDWYTITGETTKFITATSSTGYSAKFNKVTGKQVGYNESWLKLVINVSE